jgi:hypothetical protein
MFKANGLREDMINSPLEIKDIARAFIDHYHE